MSDSVDRGATGVVPPSGEQYEIRSGEHVAVVTEVGAGLRSYDVAGAGVVEGFAVDEVCSGGRGQLLVPWPNRVGRGRYAFAGRDHQLALTEPARGNANHGLTRWVPWRLAARTEVAVTLEHVLHPQPGWPGTLALRATYAIGDDVGTTGLVVTLTATNVGAGACPYGTGAHPYLTVGTPTVDDAVLTVPAATRYLVDGDLLPTGVEPVAGTPHDLRHPSGPLGPLALDTAYTDLDRDGDGRWRVRLAHPPTGRAVTLWGGPAYTHLQVFTGDGLPGGRARTGVAVEPMTCAPDAFNSGDGLVVLEPGQSHTAVWGVHPG